MREIKFRAWDKQVKRMSKPLPVYSPIIEWSDGDIAMPTDFAMGKDRVIFLQYTGLKDKNGVEIYEGDIVYQTDSLGRAYIFGCDKAFEVVWDDKWHCFSYTAADSNTNELWRAQTLKVIGNIHQHPELLEGGKE